jgi:hypothetical protein
MYPLFIVSDRVVTLPKYIQCFAYSSFSPLLTTGNHRSLLLSPEFCLFHNIIYYHVSLNDRVCSEKLVRWFYYYVNLIKIYFNKPRWYSLLLLGHKPIQNVNVIGNIVSISSYNTLISIFNYRKTAVVYLDVVAHTYNPCYLRGRDWSGRSQFKASPDKKLAKPHLNKTDMGAYL